MIQHLFTDDKYPEAEKHVRGAKSSVTVQLLQKRLDIGYGRAERLMMALVGGGVVEDVGDGLFRVK
jgi:DNA segregation ATPase FtsK/SpoIIIE-like protein